MELLFGICAMYLCDCNQVISKLWKPQTVFEKGFRLNLLSNSFYKFVSQRKMCVKFSIPKCPSSEVWPILWKIKKKISVSFARLVFNDANRFSVLLWVDAHSIELCMSFGLEFRWIHFLFQFKSSNNSNKTLEFRPPAKHKHEIMLTVF